MNYHLVGIRQSLYAYALDQSQPKDPNSIEHIIDERYNVVRAANHLSSYALEVLRKEAARYDGIRC